MSNDGNGISKHEWCRLLLLTIIINGWWIFARFPTRIIENGKEDVSFFILIPIIPTIIAIIWFFCWVLEKED